MWPAIKKPTTRGILSKLRLIHRQREHLLLITMVLLFFFNRTFLCKVMSFWMRTIRKLISIARGTYNARKFWTHRTSGSVRGLTIAWKYAYKNPTLQSGSPTHSVVTRVRSSARDRSLRIDYWTLNSHNINSMFAASGRFFHSGSHLYNFGYLDGGLVACASPFCRRGSGQIPVIHTMIFLMSWLVLCGCI